MFFLTYRLFLWFSGAHHDLQATTYMSQSRNLSSFLYLCRSFSFGYLLMNNFILTLLLLSFVSILATTPMSVYYSTTTCPIIQSILLHYLSFHTTYLTSLPILLPFLSYSITISYPSSYYISTLLPILLHSCPTQLPVLPYYLFFSTSYST
jgi:hypothetical protein